MKNQMMLKLTFFPLASIYASDDLVQGVFMFQPSQNLVVLDLDVTCSAFL